MGEVKNIIVAPCDNLRIAMSRNLGYSGIMKLTVNFDWRKLQEPMTQEEIPECVVRDALKKAGYTVSDTFVQGTWDEDKPRIPGGKWDENRLPHEEIAK
jgi:hypothetical protein